MKTHKKLHAELLEGVLIVNAILIFVILGSLVAGATVVGYMFARL